MTEDEQTCHHRSFTVVEEKVEDGAEMHLYAVCDVCGHRKSALVDWTRDTAYCGPVGDGEWETEVARVCESDGCQRAADYVIVETTRIGSAYCMTHRPALLSDDLSFTRIRDTDDREEWAE